MKIIKPDPTFIVIAALALLLASCTAGTHFSTGYHFMYTPQLDRDFHHPPDEFSRIFWDIDRYQEITFPFFAFHEMASLAELKYGNYFGPPIEKRWSVWNLCPLFMFPPICPCKEMVWERGNYRFEAVVAYPLIYKFVPHVWYWKVEEIERTDS